MNTRMNMLEKIHRSATKLIPGLRDLRYEEQLKECGLMVYSELLGKWFQPVAKWYKRLASVRLFLPLISTS